MNLCTFFDFETLRSSVACHMKVALRAMRHWDVLLGGDLGWSAAREFALTRGLEQMLHGENARRHGSLRVPPQW